MILDVVIPAYHAVRDIGEAVTHSLSLVLLRRYDPTASDEQLIERVMEKFSCQGYFLNIFDRNSFSKGM